MRINGNKIAIQDQYKNNVQLMKTLYFKRSVKNKKKNYVDKPKRLIVY